MRHILTDQARARQSHKRGGGAQPVSPDVAPLVCPDSREDLLAVDGDARTSQVVELKFFGGLTVEETAEVLNVSPETVVRDWRLAKAWLLRELSQEKLGGS